MKFIISYVSADADSGAVPSVLPVVADCIEDVLGWHQAGSAFAFGRGKAEFTVFGHRFLLRDFFQSVSAEDIQQHRVEHPDKVMDVHLDSSGQLQRYVAPRVEALDDWFERASTDTAVARAKAQAPVEPTHQTSIN